MGLARLHIRILEWNIHCQHRHIGTVLSYPDSKSRTFQIYNFHLHSKYTDQHDKFCFAIKLDRKSIKYAVSNTNRDFSRVQRCADTKRNAPKPWMIRNSPPVRVIGREMRDFERNAPGEFPKLSVTPFGKE
ncbi:hypothetical protein CEXT_768861 [Caerostris extrusa]|uniref:Uncharacterized protein n=1 Tax=Caerostris extrusa TaxID=172846 RepID=A0AAV4V4W5_CAEEX|nr:hypothetical protein CEXT_768861 [Caerostris extrusa]